MAVKTNGFIEGSLPEELKKILKSLASKWGDVIHDLKELQVIPLKGAMTNEVYQINWPIDTGTRTVLVRIYGEGVEVFFNRDDEIRTFECMSEHGHGPRLLGRFPDGRVEEFIHARTLSACDLRDPEISALVATKLREFHNLDMPGPKNVYLWDRMRNWLNEAKSLCSPKDANEFRLDTLEEEICTLEKELLRDYQDIGFCHNDLQYGNIMIDEETRSITLIRGELLIWDRNHSRKLMDGGLMQRSIMARDYISDYYMTVNLEVELLKLRFLTMLIFENRNMGKGVPKAKSSRIDGIFMPCLARGLKGRHDYEYASYNPVAYDLANHFCEMAANYHSETPHILDYGKYPDLEERQRFVRIYLSSAGNEPSDTEVEQLLHDTEKYTLANHLFWVLWGIISSYVNNIEFDYMEYARQRFRQYWLRKPILLGSS